MLRSTERYWYFSMLVFFISRMPRPVRAIVSSVVTSLQACQECQPTSLHLVLVAVNAGRGETVSPQVLSGLVLVGSAVVTPAQKVSLVTRKKVVSTGFNGLRRGVDMAGRGAVVGVR